MLMRVAPEALIGQKSSLVKRKETRKTMAFAKLVDNETHGMLSKVDRMLGLCGGVRVCV